MSKSKPEKQFLFVFIAFIFISVGLLPFFQYHINPDGICYLRIARYYSEGNFSAAINACWSPLICWLLAPLYKIGIPELIAFRLLNIVIACFILYKIHLILDKFFNNISESFRLSITVSCALELLILHFNTITPDLLTLCLLLYLLDIYLSDDIFTKPFVVGLLGALLYFTKAYSFYFFSAFIILYTIQKIAIKKFLRKDFKSLFLSVATFLLISICWIFVMHWKYHEWTISSASGYVFSILDENGIIHHPFQSQHILHPLPYAEAYFSWEDMPLIYKQTNPHPEFHKNLFTYFQLIFINCKKIGEMIFGKYPLLLVLLIPIIAFVVWKRKNTANFFRSSLLIKILAFVTLYISGYFLISVEPRYIWVLLIVCTILLFNLAFIICRNLKSSFQNIVGLIAMIPFLYTTISYIVSRINVDKKDYELAMEIKKRIPEESNIASYNSEDLWNHLFLSNLHDYGGIASYNIDKELMDDINKFTINYIVLTSPGDYQKLPEILKIKFPVYYDNSEFMILKNE